MYCELGQKVLASFLDGACIAAILQLLQLAINFFPQILILDLPRMSGTGVAVRLSLPDKP